MAIAQSIIEHIAINIKAMTLFSTHYHELVKIAESLPGVINVNTEVHEENNKVTFCIK
jgi:DNA mismatch repair protein MutS